MARELAWADSRDSNEAFPSPELCPPVRMIHSLAMSLVLKPQNA